MSEYFSRANTVKRWGWGVRGCVCVGGGVGVGGRCGVFPVYLRCGNN